MLQEFKLELERALHIIRWEPTNDELLRIAQDISRFKPALSSDLSVIVLQVCPKIGRLINEGQDNSDLRLLLAIATAVATEA